MFSYQETLDYLFAKLPMFSKIGDSAYKKDLHNTITLCNALNNPEKKFKTIHIAGTNGKGSTSHMLAAILQTAGYKTGLYTSPHLKDFRERIRINGAMCSEDFVIQFTEKIKPVIEAIEPSFFEITVAMAFDYFAKEKVDIAIIETGLGGRLDSTNIIQPEIAIITNIGYDHTNLLGNTLAEIATEKAGIIKPNTPIIIGETLPETKPIFIEKSQQQNAEIFFANDDFAITNSHYSHQYLKLTVNNSKENNADEYILDLNGFYQTKNIITVLSAINKLQKRGWNITTPIIKEALQNVKKITGLQGRWQVIQNNPTIIADVAHNEDGIKQVLQQLQLISYNKLHFIIGMVKDKAIDNVLALLPTNAQYYFTQATIARALDKEVLANKAESLKLFGNVYNNVNFAINAAKKNAVENDVIIICGSIFLVAEIK